MYNIIFYVFMFITVMSSLLVISSRNIVHSVLFLVLTFVSVACIFIMMHEEFLGLILILVYASAVSIMFLFVVMMLDINFEELRKSAKKNLPMAGLVGSVLFIELLTVISHIRYSVGNVPIPDTAGLRYGSPLVMIGDLLYSKYSIILEVAGLILTIATIGAVMLTQVFRGEKRSDQNTYKQINEPNTLRVIKDEEYNNE